MATKTIKRFVGKLPIDGSYKIVKVIHFLESDELKIIKCHNCGKKIINIATVENIEGKQFEVGLDCASTLSGITESDIENYNDAIKKGISARNSIKNCIKSRPNADHIVKVHTFKDENNYFKQIGAGGYEVYRKYPSSKEFMRETWSNYSKSLWDNIVYPYIADLVTPDEIIKKAVFYKSAIN